MIGWWDDDCPVTTSEPRDDVKATVYKRPSGEVLIAVGNFGANATEVTLVANSTALGLAAEPRSKLVAPAILGYQNATVLGLGKAFTVDGKRGFLLLLQ